MRSGSYDELRKMSRGKFAMSRFFQLKDLAGNSVGESNEILELQISLSSLSITIKNAVKENLTELRCLMWPKSWFVSSTLWKHQEYPCLNAFLAHKASV